MDEQDRGSYDPITQPVSNPAAASISKPIQQPLAADDEQGGHRNLMISATALIALALIAGAIYWFSLRSGPATAVPYGKQTATNTLQQPSSAAQISSTTKNYTSPTFNLSFSYPQDWKLNDNGVLISVTSPTLKLKNAAGQNVDGQIVLNVANQRTGGSSYTAVRASQKIAYAKPTQNQRANTYISFLQNANTTALGGLDSIYLTGDNGYQKGQTAPASDFAGLSPVISIYFTGADGKNLTITSSLWDDSNFSGPLSKLLESFSIN